MTRDSVHMVVQCPVSPLVPTQPVPSGVTIRELRADDEKALAMLFWKAYSGTIDNSYAVKDDAKTDAAETLAGQWGPLIWDASLVAEVNQEIVAAVIVVRDNAHDHVPLLAHALTEPTWQHRGIGHRLITESITRLPATGYKELHLAVTRENPAIRLYERLGFEPVPQREPT